MSCQIIATIVRKLSVLKGSSDLVAHRGNRLSMRPRLLCIVEYIFTLQIELEPTITMYANTVLKSNTVGFNDKEIVGPYKGTKYY